MAGIYTSAAQLIGNTPMLELRNIEKKDGLSVRLLAKLESWNPAGSAKDRVALSMVLDAEENSMPIKVTLNPGHRMNYHSHDKRDEVWTVVSGKGRTIVDGMEQPVQAGDVITMAAGCKHTVIADTKLQLIEVQLGNDISVNDKHKYELEI